MTETAANVTPPPDLTYGYVDGRIILAIGDRTDAGRTPDPVPAEGLTVKALIGLTINLAQRVIDDAQATRKVARQTLRLARLATGNYSTADVGTDD